MINIASIKVFTNVGNSKESFLTDLVWLKPELHTCFWEVNSGLSQYPNTLSVEQGELALAEE